MARRRLRCIFSESSRVQTLGVAGTVLPGGVPGGRAAAWRAVARVLRSPLNAAWAAGLDLTMTVFPGDCRVCGGPLLFEAEAAGPVCGECLRRLRPQRGSLCPCCGEALGMESERLVLQSTDPEAARCPACRMAPPAFSQAVAYGVYEDELRRVIHLFKYEGGRGVAPVLGRMLADAIEGLDGAGPELIVVAVPLYRPKQRVRGYNQAAMLADGAMRVLRRRGSERRFVAAHDALVRVRDTESQFALSSHARRKNMRGAFTVAQPAAIVGREVLLVDDIYTTGATARECARVLRDAGAGRVWVATLARAQKEGVALWGGGEPGLPVRFPQAEPAGGETASERQSAWADEMAARAKTRDVHADGGSW